ncbi:MAG: hypothetical protein KIG68_03715 [Oxalobacter sp.]|nr:hypothetical protein [Oxalobacter sp.]
MSELGEQLTQSMQEAVDFASGKADKSKYQVYQPVDIEKRNLRKVPEFKTDEEAEAFLDQDLSDLDWSQFVPVRFELKKKP